MSGLANVKKIREINVNWIMTIVNKDKKLRVSTLQFIGM
jgi:hypothetical protein